MTKSDHRPISVDTKFFTNFHATDSLPKRFEARWLEEETIDLIVQNAWARAATQMMCMVSCTHGKKGN